MPDSPVLSTVNPCRICGQAATPFFSKLILQKYQVAYFKCANCGLVQTEKPHWLKEAYQEAVGQLDVGMADRCIWTAQTTVALARRLGVRPVEPCLDWGGGTGLFTRLCRDYGMNFFYTDPYAQNLFARGFEIKAAGASPAWTFLTAFEVAEHLPNPLEDFGELFRQSPRYVLFSTLLYTGQPADWWYFTDNGQHIAFYTRRSLEFLARHYGYHLASNDCDLHLFSRERVADRLLDSCRKSRVKQAARYQKQHGSRIGSDFELMQKKLQVSQSA